MTTRRLTMLMAFEPAEYLLPNIKQLETSSPIAAKQVEGFNLLKRYPKIFSLFGCQVICSLSGLLWPPDGSMASFWSQTDGLFLRSCQVA